MSYTEQDAMWDRAWESMSKELYSEHKEQAIAEYSEELLQSFYLKNPQVVLVGVRRCKEASELISASPAASCVFSSSAIELFLKNALLKPVVYGLVHNESLAEIVMESALSQNSLDRYKKLMAKLLQELPGIDIATFARPRVATPLFTEVSNVQNMRNAIIHKGESIDEAGARHAHAVALAVFSVVERVLSSIGLKLNEHENIVKR